MAYNQKQNSPLFTKNELDIDSYSVDPTASNGLNKILKVL